MAHFLSRSQTLTRSLPVDIDTAFLTDVLANATFLKTAPKEKLTELVGQVPVRRYAAGETVVRQGEFGHSIFVLVRGALRVVATNEYGDQTELARLEAPGDYFGELAMLGRRRRSATVEAVEPAILLELEKTRIERLDTNLGGVLVEALERDTEQRSIRGFIQGHRFLKDLEPSGVDHLVRNAAQRLYERGKVIFAPGAPADTVLIIKTGVARLVRQNADGTESVLAYFNAGDVVGLGGGDVHGAKLVSMGFLEAIAISRAQFVVLQDF